jgi:Rad52/22 family double-strand break repair protein
MSSVPASPPSGQSAPDLFARLSAPFPDDEVQFKPQAVKGNRALAIAYIDARTVMDRLDAVVGPACWRDDYQLLPDGAMMCRLSVKIGRTWVTKVDVGSPSEQPDPGDRAKAAVSDALKRAAVKFGIGRYLYSLPPQWADYDPATRRFVNPPRLPEWARAKPANPPTPTPTPAKAVPVNGSELHRRLRAADAELAKAGTAAPGALLAHVVGAGERAGYGSELDQWTGPAIDLAVAEARAFRATPRNGQLPRV